MLRAFSTGDWSIALYLTTVGLLILAGILSPNMRLQYGVASIAGLIYLSFVLQFRSAVGS
jgi:hypothetical protein